uniref:Endonuclease-reverse transcriptase n=1 Tax=Heliothis virescens TaxID=7102 RepID=A0A2A4J436_HELVI
MSEEMSISMLYSMMKQDMEKQANLITANTEKIMLSIDEKLIPLLEENKNLKKEIEVLNQKINTLEDMNKKNNIIIHGLKETDTNYSQLYNNIKQLLQKIDVNIENFDINRMYRIGKKTPEKVRPVLISFTTYNKKIELLRNKKKMTENTYITEDYSKETLQKRKELLPQLKEEREKGNEAYIRNNKLIIKPKENEKRKRDNSTSPSTGPQQQEKAKTIIAPAKLQRTDPFAYMRSRSYSLTEKNTSNI